MLDNTIDCAQFQFTYPPSESLENIAKYKGHRTLERLNARQAIDCAQFGHTYLHSATLLPSNHLKNKCETEIWSVRALDNTKDRAQFELTYLVSESRDNSAT